MVDTAQVVLLVVIVVLALLLVVLGIQVFFILRDLRHTIEKANKVLDDTGAITQSVSQPITTISSIAAGMKVGALITGLLKKKGKEAKRQREDKQHE